MAKGFFRELKHYKVNEISIELGIEMEETKRLVGILKKYGIVKAVKAAKPEYEDLSNQDIVLTDVVENNPEIYQEKEAGYGVDTVVASILCTMLLAAC